MIHSLSLSGVDLNNHMNQEVEKNKGDNSPKDQEIFPQSE